MTEFEVAALHTELFSAIQASLTVFLSVLSGFLALSYLAAHRLKPLMAGVCLIGYAGFQIISLTGTSSLLLSFAGLVRLIRERADAGQGLDWHAASVTPPLWIIDALRPGLLVGGAIILLTSILFFFHHRRVNLVAAASA